jgi:hypothetical protein
LQISQVFFCSFATFAPENILADSGSFGRAKAEARAAARGFWSNRHIAPTLSGERATFPNRNRERELSGEEDSSIR